MSGNFCCCSCYGKVSEEELILSGKKNKGSELRNEKLKNSQKEENTLQTKTTMSFFAKNNEYGLEVFKLINQIREDPGSFALIVEKTIDNIKEINNKLIYEGDNVKVSLSQGAPLFSEVSLLLQQLNPLPAFIWSNEIAIDVPTDENEMKDANVFKNKVNSKSNFTPIYQALKETIKDPFVSVLMMIVDDNKNDNPIKRNTLLNPDIKKIAITSNYINKTFCAYLTFSNE